MANISKLSSYACGSCGKSFKKYPQLQKHRIQERDAGNGHMHCETCGIDFPFATQLIAHFREVSTRASARASPLYSLCDLNHRLKLTGTR
jgi:DNA-directed RNA polymerase subunit RPC12/RpoP